jgi:hypothetical protein
LLNCKLLHDLGDVGNPLYSLVVEKTGHGWPSVTVQFGWTSTVVGAPSGGALAPKITSAATVQAEGGASPSNESARGAPVTRFDCGRRQWRRRLGMGAKHTGRTSIYRGFCSLCSQGGLWLNPSLNGFKSTKFGEKINWG